MSRESLIDVIENATREGSKLYSGRDGSWRKCAEHIYHAIRAHQAEQPLPAWSEQGYAAACADMATQTEASRNGGGGELLAANVCISSLCIAYKNAAMRRSEIYLLGVDDVIDRLKAHYKYPATPLSGNERALIRDVLNILQLPKLETETHDDGRRKGTSKLVFKNGHISKSESQRS